MIITTEPTDASKKTPTDNKRSFSTVFTRAYEREVVVNHRQYPAMMSATTPTNPTARSQTKYFIATNDSV